MVLFFNVIIILVYMHYTPVDFYSIRFFMELDIWKNKLIVAAN